jgi:transposase-like protein
MNSARSRYRGHRFPPEIIGYAVWVHHRFCLSFRDVEDLLAERGIIVSYEIRCPGKRPVVFKNSVRTKTTVQ